MNEINSRSNKKKPSINVLVLDDSVSVGEIIEGYLELYTVNVIKTNYCKKAFLIMEEVKIDCLFLDIILAPMNGFEIANEIRKKEGEFCSDPCYIIGITGMCYDSMRKQCMDAGMNDYIPKPLTVETMTKAFNTFLLEKRKQGQNV